MLSEILVCAKDYHLQHIKTNYWQGIFSPFIFKICLNILWTKKIKWNNKYKDVNSSRAYVEMCKKNWIADYKNNAEQHTKSPRRGKWGGEGIFSNFT